MYLTAVIDWNSRYILPKDTPTHGTCTIIVPLSKGGEANSSISPHTFGFWNLKHLEQSALELGFETKLIFYNDEDPIRTKSHFSPATQGIISFVSAGDLKSAGIRDSKIPIIYLGVEDRLSQPSVTGDVFLACYNLTRQMISNGHRNILLHTPSSLGTMEFTELVEGHRSAMATAGLPVNEAALLHSRDSGVDMLRLKKYLGEFPETTAIVTVDANVARRLVELAELLEIDVPGRLSISCLYSCKVDRNSSTLMIQCCYYDWEDIMNRCFAMLLQESNMPRTFRMSFPPLLQQGESVSAISKKVTALEPLHCTVSPSL